MRTMRTMRAPRAAQMAAGALILAVPSSAYALTSSQTAARDARPAVPAGLAAVPQRSRVTFGTDAIERGISFPALARRSALRVRVPARPIAIAAGTTATLGGRLLPAGPGRLVRLLTRSGSGWSTLARTRTGGRGGFRLRYLVPAGGSHPLRVVFAGDRLSRSASAPAGAVTGLDATVASWYYDGGTTACGFHAHFGVASPTVPCGTKVTFAYGGRSVVATVDDRGPFVPGRSYDLNENTAAALDMNGVATVLASA